MKCSSADFHHLAIPNYRSHPPPLNRYLALLFPRLNTQVQVDTSQTTIATNKIIRNAKWEQPSYVTSPDCFTRLSRWRPAGSSNQPEGHFWMPKKLYLGEQNTFFYAKYFLFSIFRAFSAIFTLRVEDPLNNSSVKQVLKLITSFARFRQNT